jgi:hypothetical protein
MTGFMGYEQASSTHNQYGGEQESKSTDKKVTTDTPTQMIDNAEN